jgi:RNA polymerase sigma-70 factor (ECF subfamily)
MYLKHAKFREELVSLLPRLRRFARALTRHPADADDLVQLAVERALARTEQWRPGTSQLNWMLGIVRNAWIDELRSRRRRKELFVSDDVAAMSVAMPSIDVDIEAWSIHRGLETLPEEQQLAIALVVVEGLSYAEAAKVMGVPIGTLTSRLARGRSALEAFLSQQQVPRRESGDGR